MSQESGEASAEMSLQDACSHQAGDYAAFNFQPLPLQHQEVAHVPLPP